LGIRILADFNTVHAEPVEASELQPNVSGVNCQAKLSTGQTQLPVTADKAIVQGEVPPGRETVSHFLGVASIAKPSMGSAAIPSQPDVITYVLAITCNILRRANETQKYTAKRPAFLSASDRSTPRTRHHPQKNREKTPKYVEIRTKVRISTY
jgi:hypothetical protein